MFANLSNGKPAGGSGGTNGEAAPAPKPKSTKATTIEETYQKKSQLEHILLRPDTYIGSVEKVGWFNHCFPVTINLLLQPLKDP